MTSTKETSMKHLFLAGLIVLGLAATEIGRAHV